MVVRTEKELRAFITGKRNDFRHIVFRGIGVDLQVTTGLSTVLETGEYRHHCIKAYGNNNHLTFWVNPEKEGDVDFAVYIIKCFGDYSSKSIGKSRFE